MLSIRVKLRSSARLGREGCVFYQLTCRKRQKLIRTDYRLLQEEWDSDRLVIRIQESAYHRRDYLKNIEQSILSDLSFLRVSHDQLFVYIDESNYLERLFLRFKEYHRSTFFVFLQKEIDRLREAGKSKTAAGYASALRSLSAFLQEEDIRINTIREEQINRYQHHLQQRGICANTISYYMRILRAVYNRAVANGLTPQNHPFKQAYTGIGKTLKRAVDPDVVRRLKELNLTNKPLLALSRDLFLFSFYTRGMSFVDMAHLRKTDCSGEYIVYRRRKTKQRITIKLESCIREIIHRYQLQTIHSEWLLPILYSGKKPIRYESALRMQNKRLHILSQLLSPEVNLTSYVARHTWATLAKRKGIPLQTISEGMGHDNEKTTRIYLASLDQSVVDDANAMILSDYE